MTKSSVQCQAFIPAAGFGTRLLPLTKATPKPALEFRCVPSIYLTIYKLEKFGFRDVAVNAHHHADQIFSLLKNYPNSAMRFFESLEAEEILGTGGCHNPLKSWRENMNLMIYNPDIISDLNLKLVLLQHEKNKSVATMVLLPETREGSSPVWVDHEDRILSFGSRPDEAAKPCYGAGIYILSPEFMSYVKPQGSFSIIDSFREAMSAGCMVKAYFHYGEWYDFGENLNQYLEVQLAVLKNKPLFDELGIEYLLNKMGTTFSYFLLGKKDSVIGPALICSKIKSNSIELGPNIIIGQNVTISGGTQLNNAVALSGSHLEGDIHNAIASPHETLNLSKKLTRQSE